MADIFISYASEDRSRVAPLAKAIADHGWSIWWDRNIPAGKTWREVIGEALENARSVVVVWSKTSVKSRWVQEEADWGLERKILVPILIDNVRPPLGFGAVQAIDLVNWDPAQSSPEFEKLISDISIILGPSPRNVKEAEQVAEKERKRKQEEEIKRKEDEQRKAEEESQRLEQEKRRITKEKIRLEKEKQKADEEQKAEEERKRKEIEARRKAEEERKRKEAEAEAERARKAEAERKAEEKRKFEAEEERRKAEERRRFEEKQKRAEAERKSEEESRRKTEENRKRREAEEAERKAEEDQHHWEQEEERKRKETEEQERARRAEIERKAEEERKRKAIPNTYRNIIGMEFVLIPAGSFTMGSSIGLTYEAPVHEVKISQPFYLQTTAATQGQWNKVMKDEDNPSNFKRFGDDYPVEGVSWEDAQKFIEKLNQLEKTKGYRLPSEAEWEYACRAGTTTEFSFGKYDFSLGKYAWYDENSKWGQFLPIRRSHPVATKNPNPWGLYDIHGNVWEWVEDDWHSSYRKAPNDGSAWIDKPRGHSRVMRGGYWGSVARDCRSAARGGDFPADRLPNVGFRLAMSIPTTP